MRRKFWHLLGALALLAFVGCSTGIGSATPRARRELTISTPLALDKTSVAPGERLTGTVTFRNDSGSPLSVKQILIAGLPPGATHTGGPHRDLTPALGAQTIQPGATVTLTASRDFTSADPTGQWQSYATYQDNNNVWHDGPSVTFQVVPPPVLTISTPLALDKTSVAPGERLTGTVTFRNNSGVALSVNQIVIAGLPPGATHTGGPHQDLAPALGAQTIQPGATVTLTASRDFTGTDATGQWEAYATYQDSNNVWHDGPSVTFQVVPPRVLTISTPLALDKTSVASGERLTGTVTFRNDSGAALSVNQIVIAGLPPGATHIGGPHQDLTPTLGAQTIQPGATITLTASRDFTSADPTGQWEAYATYQDSNNVWHDGPSVTFQVVAAQGALTISTPLALDKTSVAPSDRLTGTVTFRNDSGVALTVNQIVIAGLPPGATHAAGPHQDLTPALGVQTIQPGATVTLTASRDFTSADPTGQWEAYATYQDGNNVWHDGPSVTFQVVSTPPSGNESPNLLGIGISAPLDWEGAQIYADVIRQSRDVVQASGTGTVVVDSNGWPLETDFMIGVWAGINQMHGTYALSFSGQATSVSANGGIVTGLAYNAATNTSTASVVVTDTGDSALQLVFRGTQRRDGSGQAGVTAIKLMRPISPGSNLSYPTTTLFHTPLQTLVRKFQVVRFMQYLATNSNQQSTWTDRPLPSWMSFARYVEQNGYAWEGIGGTLEHVILFANETGRDAWINIPAKADDAYIRNVALMFRYGSDGVNPYTSPQASPVFPPLNPGLKLYVEYSNELWNCCSNTFSQSRWNWDTANAEVFAGNSPLNYDNHSDQPWAMRRVAKRIAEISLSFRQVFGDSEMMTRVRPVLMSQGYNSGATLAQGLKWLYGYAANGEGNFVPDPVKWNHPPQPVNYYIYGAGGSGYWATIRANDGFEPIMDINNIWTTEDMDEVGWSRRALFDDAYRTAAFGLKRIAYEGGPDLPGLPENVAVKTQAVMTFRGTPGVPDNMTDNFIRHHDTWSQMGGDLFVYFTAVHNYQWGFASLKNWQAGDVYDLNSPKLLAIDELNTKPRAASTLGVTVPGSTPGAAIAVSHYDYETPRPDWTGGRNLTGPTQWAGYVFRVADTASRTVTLTLSSASGNVSVYWDGVLVGTKTATGGTITFAVGASTPGMHGVLVRAASGSFSLDQVRVD